MFICVCMCAPVCESERERAREGVLERAKLAKRARAAQRRGRRSGGCVVGGRVGAPSPKRAPHWSAGPTGRRDLPRDHRPRLPPAGHGAAWRGLARHRCQGLGLGHQHWARPSLNYAAPSLHQIPSLSVAPSRPSLSGSTSTPLPRGPPASQFLRYVRIKPPAVRGPPHSGLHTYPVLRDLGQTVGQVAPRPPRETDGTARRVKQGTAVVAAFFGCSAG